MRTARRIVGGLRQLLPVVLCALGGHVALYHELRPDDSGHAYFAWYAPLILGLSFAALAAFTAMLLAAALGRSNVRRVVARLLLPGVVQPENVAARATRLALASTAFLVCQESLERSVAASRPVPAAFTPGQIAVLLVALSILAAIVAFLERSCVELIAQVLGRTMWRRRLVAAPTAFSERFCFVFARRNPLADRRGLRAPPLIV
jgi:hypothetical protein